MEDIKVDLTDLFIEFDYPNTVHGLSRSDPKAIKIIDEIYRHRNEPNWRYDGYENYTDLKKRVNKAITFLESLDKENVLVISHSFYLRFLISKILSNKLNQRNEKLKLINTFFPVYYNTALSLLVFNDDKWSLRFFNDYSYLASLLTD